MRFIFFATLVVCNHAITHCIGADRKVAVLVGINDYEKIDRPLRFAEADVRDVGAELAALGFETHLLLGSQATKASIGSKIDDVVAELGKTDLILVMLAGHGQQITVRDSSGNASEDSFFCPVDGVAGYEDRLYSISYLIDKQLSPNVGRIIVIIDACRETPANVGRGIQGKVVALREDAAILFSCRSGQQSFEPQELRHGIFTYSLLEALRGGAARDGQIVWSQVVSYVDWRMASQKLRTYMPAPQVPISAGGVPYAVLGSGNWEKKIHSAEEAPPPELNEFFINSLGMKLVRIPAGEFQMGSNHTESGRDLDEEPHIVQITRPFYLGCYEVTQSEFDQVKKSNPSYFQHEGDGDKSLDGNLSDQLPVEQVSWQEAVEFCRSLSKIPAELKANRRYRLPTEAEWEYSCRARSTTPFSFGTGFDAGKANADARFGESTDALSASVHNRTLDVAMFYPNAFGLYNMHGNVAEWCQDWYSEDYYWHSPARDPVGPATGSLKIIRGGSWFDNPLLTRSADRQAASPQTELLPFFGFRVVCDFQ